MINVGIYFFGPARDVTGCEHLTLPLADGATLTDVVAALHERFPEWTRRLSSARLAVNHEFAAADAALRDGDEVAVIPPVSGGSGDGVWVALMREPLPVDQVHAFMRMDSAAGGVVTFEGAVRPEVDDTHGDLLRLDYDAYDVMALQQLRNLCEQARQRWSVRRMAVLHRIGSVPPGELAVIVAVACAHRAEAFDACRWLIDTLKKDVPIWKKDVFEDGFTRWVTPAGFEERHD